MNMLKQIQWLLGAIVFASATPGLQVFAEDQAAEMEFFESRIRPVLVEHCYQCHSSDSKSLKGGLLLDTRDGIRAGGDSGHAVVPNDIDESLLIAALKYESYEMPPSGPLSEAIVADFEKWIEMGAPDPREGKAIASERDINIEAGKDFWAFQPLQTPSIPQDASGRSPQDIDAFVMAKLEEAGLQQVTAANRETLIRRLSFDLLGLPPTPAQIDEFVNDQSEDAYEKLVDRMLNSPHFGERWGRHWLDVVRYAESIGKTRNFPFPYAWRYRDYVIDSFNEDKPYDQFIREQLAGDLLPAETDEQQDEQLVATGFLALGSHDLNQRNRAAFTMDVVGEQIDTMSRSIMALTLACARCHDHKFDPIPTDDYYALAGIFRSTALLNGYSNRNRANEYKNNSMFHELATVGKVKNSRSISTGSAGKGGRRNVAAQLERDKKQFEKARVFVGELRKELKALQDDQSLSRKAKRAKVDSLRPKLKQAQNRVRNLKNRIAKAQADNKAKNNKVKGGPSMTDPVAMGVRDANQPRDCRINIRGDANRLGEPVPRGFLQVAALSQTPEIADDSSGRLELASWLTDPEHPLTSRVMVNRIWHHLFGAGLVRTVDNFGQTGERPSHPELLDYLARKYMQEGWSTKQLIRSIVLSQTYQLSSHHDDANFESDPDNRLFWRMNRRRLEAEVIRDSVLFVSGSLELKPPTGSVVQDLAVAELGRRQNTRVELTQDRHRTIYFPVIRAKVPTFLVNFDFPEPSEVKGRRDVTTVPTQALYMMNNPLVVEHSKLAAKRLLQEELSDEERIQQAYRSTIGRNATPEQSDRVLAFLKSAEPESNKERLDTWSDIMHALIASAEFRYRN